MTAFKQESGNTPTAGHWSMADISEKAVTRRLAIAAGSIRVGQDAFSLLASGGLPKGDALAMAEIAGIQAAKQTPALLPLCHPISLNRAMIRPVLRPEDQAVEVFAAAEIAERTGVEMEALTAVSVGLLTAYDLLKAVERGIALEGIRLLEKRGGRSGEWKAEEA